VSRSETASLSSSRRRPGVVQLGGVGRGGLIKWGGRQPLSPQLEPPPGRGREGGMNRKKGNEEGHAVGVVEGLGGGESASGLFGAPSVSAPIQADPDGDGGQRK
jgi:hypothetical protein